MDAHRDEMFANLNGIGELHKGWLRPKKHIIYPLLYLLLKLALISPMATTNVE